MARQREMNATLGRLARTSRFCTVTFLTARDNKQCAFKSIVKTAHIQLQDMLKNVHDIYDQIPILWTSQAEVKEKLKQHQEEPDQKVPQHLSEQTENQSFPSGIYLQRGLTRAATGTILRFLADMICAARFKTLGNNKLMTTKSPKCGAINSWVHHKRCYGLSAPNHAVGKHG